MNLFEELKRRHVFRVAGVYAVAGWLLAQAAIVLETSLKLPDWFDSVVVSFLLLGLPVALILAWAFEMTPEGVKLTANVAEGESIAPKTGRKLDYAILGGVALIAVMFVYDRMTPEPFVTPPSAAPQGEEKTLHPEERREASRHEGRTEEAATRSVAGVSKDAPDASIAVLPFADLSPAKDQEYFSDGMAEEILNVLAKVEGLTVAARTSSFAFRGQETLGIPAIAKELGVRHILEGSVRKSGDAIRITAQLIDSKSDAHLWSQTFDRKLTAENIFALQDEIAGAIVGALRDRIRLSPGTAAPAAEAAKPTTDLSAYDLYLQARALYQRREQIEEAEALLGKAVMRDPDFADAWALRAATASLFKEYVATDRSHDDIGKLVDAYAERALALDPDNARAIAARANFRITAAWSLAHKYDIAGIIADLKRAIALDPRDSSAVNWLGMTYAVVGDNDKALETFIACAEIDPLFGPCAENIYDLLVVEGRYDEALAQFQKVLAKGYTVGAWTNFGMLAHFNEKTAFMQAANNAEWLRGWRRQDEVYEAFKHPEADHSALIADLEEFLKGRLNRGVNNYSVLLIPIGAFDWPPYPIKLWGPDHARYRRSPQFKAYIRDSGVYDYWRKAGFPPQCTPRGPQNSENADFECE